MGLKSYLILRELHRILSLPRKYFLFSDLAPPGFAIFQVHCVSSKMPWYGHVMPWYMGM